MHANFAPTNCVCLPTCCCLATFPLPDVIHTLFFPVAWQHYIVMSFAPAKKICGGCQMCVPRSIDPLTTKKSRLKIVIGSVLPTSNAIIWVRGQYQYYVVFGILTVWSIRLLSLRKYRQVCLAALDRSGLDESGLAGLILLEWIVFWTGLV